MIGRYHGDVDSDPRFYNERIGIRYKHTVSHTSLLWRCWWRLFYATRNLSSNFVPTTIYRHENFAGFDGTFARLATDAYKIFVVKHIVRNIIFFDIIEGLFEALDKQWIVFDNFVSSVLLKFLQIAVLFRLVST